MHRYADHGPLGEAGGLTFDNDAGLPMSTADNTLVIDVGEVADSGSFTLSVDAPEGTTADGTTWTFTPRIAAEGVEPVEASTSVTGTFDVPFAMTMTITGPSTTQMVGSEFAFSVDVDCDLRYAGPITVEVTLPGGLDFVSANPAAQVEGKVVRWNETGDTVGGTCGPGEGQSLDVTVRATSEGLPQNPWPFVQTVVHVAGQSLDGVPASADDSTWVIIRGDDRLPTTYSVSVDRAVAIPGDLLTYTIDIANPDIVDRYLVIGNALPPGVTPVSASDDPYYAEAPPEVTWASGIYIWPYEQVRIPAGSTKQLVVTARVNEGTEGTQQSSLIAALGPDDGYQHVAEHRCEAELLERAQVPDASCVTTSVVAAVSTLEVLQQVCTLPDSALCDPSRDELWATSVSLPAGATATWRVIARNTGTTDLTEVTVTEALPSGLGSPSSVAASAGDTSGFPSTWTIAELSRGTTQYLTYTTTVPSVAGQVESSASASATGPDGSAVPAPASTASVTVTTDPVTQEPDEPQEPEEDQNPADPDGPSTVPVPATAGGGSSPAAGAAHSEVAAKEARAPLAISHSPLALTGAPWVAGLSWVAASMVVAGLALVRAGLRRR